jgi:hypothetical protein
MGARYVVIRRSRKPRLGFAYSHYGSPIAISGENWADLEKALCAKIGADDRTKITAIAQRYIDYEPFERKAPFVADARNYMNRVARAAKALADVMRDGHSGASNPKGVGASMIESMFDTELGFVNLPHRRRYRELANAATVFAMAHKRVAERFEADVANLGFVEGDEWDRMVNKLTAWARQKGLPTGASKGRDKSASDTPSTFLAFLRGLQGLLPEEQRRHLHSDLALAQAVHAARRNRRALPAKESGNGKEG